MSTEENKGNGKVEEENLSSSEGLLTYTRKKHKRTCEIFSHEENGGVLVNGKVSHFASSQVNGKDIGWEHGNIVNGNRFHWKCKWCSFVGHSGGVTRLKQHLAGGWHVRKCSKVPRHISLTMKNHLIEKKSLKRRKRRRKKDDIDITQVSDVSQESKRTTRRFKTTCRRSSSSYGRSNVVTRRSNIDVTKVEEEPQDTMLQADIYEESHVDSTGNHWRTVLKQMLHMPNVYKGGCILSSISDALKACPAGNNRKSTVTDAFGKCKMSDISTDNVVPKDRHKNHFGVPGQTPIVDTDGTGIDGQTDKTANKKEFQDVFLNILCSEKFILLCNLLCENFQGVKVDRLFDLNPINSKMENGVYGQCPELFNQDLQQMWGRIQKVGEEMVLLASSLSNMSQYVHQKQLSIQLNFVAKNSNESDNATQFPSCESVPSAKPIHTEASFLYEVCTCKQCGTEADVKHSLICDECESVYHFSCVVPAVHDIPTRNWYCNSCSKDGTQSSGPPIKNNSQQGSLHDSCAVCERLEVSETKELPTANDSRESSVSILESEEPLEPSRTALARLCKNCGTCEDEDKRFLICGHGQCPYKYYHIRCLKSSQIASLQQRNNQCWYCPSCLCRACFCDQDDDMIVLCDGCDEAYHTYCMKPPRNSIPKGQWYCLQCNVAKAKEGMRRYEQWVLQQHGKKDARQTDETRSMDVLLSVVDKFSADENLNAM